jgi:hypothetical protein
MLFDAQCSPVSGVAVLRSPKKKMSSWLGQDVEKTYTPICHCT